MGKQINRVRNWKQFLNENYRKLSYKETSGPLKEFAEGLKKDLEENKFAVVDNPKDNESLVTGEKIVIFFIDDSDFLRVNFLNDFRDDVIDSINKILKSFGDSMMYSNPYDMGMVGGTDKRVISIGFKAA
jgi:hypothetical protein